MPFSLIRSFFLSPTLQFIVGRQLDVSVRPAGLANDDDDLSVLCNLGSRHANPGIARGLDGACQVGLTKCARVTRHVSNSQNSTLSSPSRCIAISGGHRELCSFQGGASAHIR